jgi:mono/diheme cytochrome c family protein
MSKTPLFLLAPLFATACLSLTHAQDHVDVQARYSNKNATECSSWLRSHKTGFLYCASPAFVAGADGTSTEAEAGPALAELAAADKIVDEKHLVERGAAVYEAVCQACHQADGKGLTGSFPPLAGSGDFYGSPAKQAGIIINGLSGEIVVQDVQYNGAMPAQGHLDDYDIAAVASYVRTSWGNNDGLVTPDDVAGAR